MKNRADLSFAEVLIPAQMNQIHFGGNQTPLTPEQIEKMAHAESAVGSSDVQEHNDKPRS